MDVLRLTACIMVLLRHWLSQEWNFLEIYTAKFEGDPKLVREIQKLFDLGFLGVDVFFLISGAVIVRSVLTQDKSTFRVGIIEFVVSRFYRLAPIYVLTLIPAILIGRKIFNDAEYFSARSILGSLTMSNYFYLLPAPNGQSWTLFVEVKFYFLISLLLFLGRAFIYSARKIIFLFFVFWLAYYISALSVDSIFLDNFLISNFAPYFITGGLLGLARDRRDLLTLLPILALTTTLCLFITNERIVSELGDSELSLIGSLIVVSAVAILIVDNVFKFRSQIWITELFGRLTYPIYMLHMVIGTGFIKFGINLGFSLWISLVVTLSILVVISAVYLYLVEDKYIQTLKKRTSISLSNFVN